MSAPEISSLRSGAGSFRHAMRQIPWPIVIVTATDGRIRRGMTVSSFTSVSLEPELVSFCVRRPSRMHVVMERAQRFAVHALAGESVALYRRFAAPGLTGEQQFAGLAYSLEWGVPILHDAPVVLLADVLERIAAGDHSIIIGRVSGVREASCGFQPVVYHQGEYRMVSGDRRSCAPAVMNASRTRTIPFDDSLVVTHETT